MSVDFFSLTKEQKEEVVKRYNKCVDKNGKNGCWKWKGTFKPKTKYGIVRLQKIIEKKKTIVFQVRAHRLSWMIKYNTPVPPSLLCCHSCDNPECTRPEHIFLGTHAHNSKDSSQKDRRMKLPLSKRLEVVDKIMNGMSLTKASRLYSASIPSLHRYLSTKEVVEKYGEISLSHRWKRKKEILEKAACNQTKKVGDVTQDR